MVSFPAEYDSEDELDLQMLSPKLSSLVGANLEEASEFIDSRRHARQAIPIASAVNVVAALHCGKH